VQIIAGDKVKADCTLANVTIIIK